MLKTKMRKWCLLLLLLGCSMGVQAQYSMGNTGLLNIPTADMQETGTFMGGVGGNLIFGQCGRGQNACQQHNAQQGY